MRRGDLGWRQLDPVQTVASGVLLLLHAEGRALRARLANPNGIAKCGQAVPVGVTPGDYRVETVLIDELPNGTTCCVLCRWVPADG